MLNGKYVYSPFPIRIQTRKMLLRANQRNHERRRRLNGQREHWKSTNNPITTRRTMTKMMIGKLRKFWTFVFIVIKVETFWFVGKTTRRIQTPGSRRLISIVRNWFANLWRNWKRWRSAIRKSCGKCGRWPSGTHWWHNRQQDACRNATITDNGKCAFGFLRSDK